jgi:integrase
MRQRHKPISTALQFENIKPKKKGYEVRDLKQGGLYLRVRPNGSTSWVFRYRFPKGSKSKAIVIGCKVGLKDARDIASGYGRLLLENKDPAVVRKAAIQATALSSDTTVQSVCEKYMTQAGSKLRSADSRRRILERSVYPTLGTKQISEVTREQVSIVLDRVAEKRTDKSGRQRGGELASNMVLAILSKVFKWYEVKVGTFRNPLVAGMARDKSKPRERKLNDDEIKRVWLACDDPRLMIYGSAVRMLILTGARRNEVAQMRRSEVKNGDWELPEGRSKIKKPILRPLPQLTQEILENLPDDGSEWFFTRNGRTAIALNDAVPKNLLDQISGVTDWHLHDLRRTCRSIMSRKALRITSDVAELCLGHVLPGGLVRKTYDVHDYREEKADAYDSYAAEISRIVHGGEVVDARDRFKR